MQPTSWPVGAGEMGETGTPGGWPKTWASLRVVRIRPARSLAESAFAAEKDVRGEEQPFAGAGAGL